jgi:PhnB protein
MNLGATLYVRNSAEAVEFYIKAFRMTLGYNAKNSDGSFLHAELLRGEREIFAVSENSDEEIVRSMLASKQPTMSYGINLDDDDELNHAYNTLAEGGHILRELGSLPWSPCSADVVDKYGVCWYIYVSQHRPD